MTGYTEAAFILFQRHSERQKKENHGMDENEKREGKMRWIKASCSHFVHNTSTRVKRYTHTHTHTHTHTPTHTHTQTHHHTTHNHKHTTTHTHTLHNPATPHNPPPLRPLPTQDSTEPSSTQPLQRALPRQLSFTARVPHSPAQPSTTHMSH